MLKNKGITLIALIITIIILLILAGITIGAITGDNSLINQAGEAKENAEIASEKEVIDNASIEAMGKNKYGNLEEEEFQNALDSQTGGKAEVTDMGENFEVFFTESNRYYKVDKDGNVGDFTIAVTDPYPGDITKDENGNTLTGDSEADAYQINCIEDLVVLSNLSRGEGFAIENGETRELTQEDKTSFSKKYVVLTRDLNFKSKSSYVDSQRTDFGDINGDNDDGNSLITEMTSGYGFSPLELFTGTLNGNGKILRNLYEKKEGNAGLIESAQGGSVKNLEITGNIICSGNNAGGISAYHGNFENCINRVNIESTGNYIGGICGGEYAGTIVNCKNYASIEGNAAIGGIGATWGQITNCQNYGMITGTNGIGGISGRYASIKNCENYGEIKASETSGGIVGQTTDNIINSCTNYGKVSSKKYSGGIAGNLLNATIINCTNKGKIETTEVGTGGIGGEGDNYRYIINCNNFGNLVGNEEVGEIVGSLKFIQSHLGFSGKIINCCNIGNMEATKNKGGIVGRKSGYGTNYIDKCYWLKEISSEGVGEITSGSEGNIEITNSEACEKTYMQTEDFLNKLNNYVEEYNNGDKEFTNSLELLYWNFDEETGYPKLNYNESN